MKKSIVTNEYLERLALGISGLATAMWIVPLKFNNEEYEYNDLLTAPFNGLTNFDAYINGNNVGRMPSFVALAFLAIFLLQLRRR